MKIGVWISYNYAKDGGGGVSYMDKLISALDEHKFPEGIEVCYVTHNRNLNLNKKNVCVSQVPAIFYKLFAFSEKITDFVKRVDRKLIKIRGLKSLLNGTDIKLIMYIQQGFCLDSDFPFISTNWDIGHRSTYSFPEIVGDFENRDDFYKNILPKALLIGCESETGKEEVMRYTNIGGHKIDVLPMFAGEVSSINSTIEEQEEYLSAHGLIRNKFFFYPAQFWAHKNHVGLLKAFAAFVKDHREFKLVLSGSNQGNKTYIVQYVKDLGLQENVIFLGFVANKDISILYRTATCMIMPTYFGPTNMPPIEAMECGCPVICSDIGGHREILGENAIYIDPMDVGSIKTAMEEMVSHRQKYVDYITRQKGITRFNIKSYLEHLDKFLLKAKTIRENWE